MNDVLKACEFFKEFDEFEIFTHIHPDGDALGSSFALKYALEKMGKKAKVTCLDTFPEVFKYIWNVEENDFDAKKTVTVDVADVILLGDGFDKNRVIDFAIDHHKNNKVEAKEVLCDPTCAACGEIIYEIVKSLGVELDLYLSECLYTALATDTGCFRFSNTTNETFLIASHLTSHTPNNNFGYLNTPLFSTKSKKQISLENAVFSSLSYAFDDKVAIALVSKDLIKSLDLSDDDLIGVEQLAKCIKGVKVGITLKERDNGYKISMRSDDDVDVAQICAKFGGGGHHSAAGCFINGDESFAKHSLLTAIEEGGVI